MLPWRRRLSSSQHKRPAGEQQILAIFLFFRIMCRQLLFKLGKSITENTKGIQTAMNRIHGIKNQVFSS